MTNWRVRAACRNEDPELFWPLSTAATGQIAEARAVCRRCPSTAECLDDAIRHNDDGIRGGTTYPERKRAASERGRADQAAEAQRLAAGINALPAAAWRAIRGSDSRGGLPADTSWETKRLLVRAGLAHEGVGDGKRGGSSVRVNAAGRALAAGGVVELTGANR